MPRAARQIGEQLDDRVAVQRVERARRLVGEQQPALADDRPGDGDALLLSAREVVGIAVEVVVEADRVQRVDRASTRAARARTPSSSRGSITFSTAVSDGTRLSRWNT